VDIHKSLRQVLDAHPSTAPQAESIHEILKILFTPQEAAVAVRMSYKVKPVVAIAAKVGLSENETKKHLEAMADKGIIMSRYKEGEKFYGLLPLIPGVFCTSGWENCGKTITEKPSGPLLPATRPR